MKIFDAHCDALSKLYEHRDLLFTQKDERLMTSLPELQEGNVQFQVFAVYVAEQVHSNSRLTTALHMIDLFYNQVEPSGYRAIRTKEEMLEAKRNDQNGGFLFLEGAGALEGSLVNLRTLYRLGVRGMGLTWNYRNEVADGCLEPKPGGLTVFGRQVIREMNHLGMIIDVSHIAEVGFWDTLELSSSPVIASHSNVKKLCNHPRNLSDQQIDAMIAKDGVIGLSFIPYFNTSEKRTVYVSDLFKHLDYICERGGVENVAFGSDFDGEDLTFGDLTRASTYDFLLNELLKRYKPEEVEKFVQKNWLRVLTKVLQ
ncbi:dipeptidase [Brevibacillus ginsengisoli]|uniref:dipeptidase n=1 Tax=Brevibacillus ginsengisoli TaxID=363854 RepID=UPI003CF98D7D